METWRLPSAIQNSPIWSSPVKAPLAAGLVVLIIVNFNYYKRYSRSTEATQAEKVSAKVSEKVSEKPSEAELLDPQILKTNSEIRSYVTADAVYDSIRTFYHRHPHADKLPGVEKLPLLVFVHGLGGSLVQFAPLLESLTNVAPCFAIELPGCGRSAFLPTSYSAYTIEALAALVKTAVEAACRERGHDSVVLIAHSLGCSISALLTSENALDETKLSKTVRGVVAVCPKASPLTRTQSAIYRIIFALPDFVVDGLRWLDRRGGTESASVTRFIGESDDSNLKQLQSRVNALFSTPVLKRTALGVLSTYDSNGAAQGGMPGENIWKGVQVPLLLVAGEADVVTKIAELELVVSYLTDKSKATEQGISSFLNTDVNDSAHDSPTAFRADERSLGIQATTTESTTHHEVVIKTAILPAPAAHALLYDPATYRIVAGLIENFLSEHISHDLSFGFQLQQLTTSGKWEVKNLEKWKKVMPVSGPIAGGIFRAMKTLREQDEEHTPTVFVERWKGKIYAVIDISHDRPIYNTQTLEKGGIQYHKFPTVSKIPPTPVEVKDFIALVDKLRKESESKSAKKEAKKPAIGCHCHYGYNRTGFFIICYLVEKENYRLQDAIDEFAKQKPPGIRHAHFLDTLFVRYCVGLRNVPAPT